DVEAGEQFADRRAERTLDDGARHLAVERRDLVLQQCEVVDDVRRQQVAAGREDLPELDEDRPQLLQRQAQAGTARLRRDRGRGARHERPHQLEPALGRGVVQQGIEPVAQQDAADACGAQDAAQAVLRADRRATRAAMRSTSSRRLSTSSRKASSSARGTTSRDSSVTYSAALRASWPPTLRAWARAPAMALATCTPMISPNTVTKGCCQSGSKRSARRCRLRASSASPETRTRPTVGASSRRRNGSWPRRPPSVIRTARSG